MMRLEKQGFQFTIFRRNEPIPQDVDLYWDPRSGGGQHPYRHLRKIDKPLVVTVHGMALFTMPIHELYAAGTEAWEARKSKVKYRYGWRRMKSKVSKVITVSKYSKQEVLSTLSFAEKDVIPIWNGYDDEKFRTKNSEFAMNEGRPYFLTVLSYQKKKNFERMVAAYQMLPEDDRPDFVAIIKPFEKDPGIKGLKIISHRLDLDEIIRYYQDALALVFPTLHEGFGLPVIEAMACGCPVITSNVTASDEVAGNAAIKVDPRSVEAIKDAMIRIQDPAVRKELLPLMAERITHFGWYKCAQEHKAVFEGLIEK
jgi:glycosyltransferase involved in cell wall biosynthesis